MRAKLSLRACAESDQAVILTRALEINFPDRGFDWDRGVDDIPHVFLTTSATVHEGAELRAWADGFCKALEAFPCGWKEGSKQCD